MNPFLIGLLHQEAVSRDLRISVPPSDKDEFVWLWGLRAVAGLESLEHVDRDLAHTGMSKAPQPQICKS